MQTSTLGEPATASCNASVEPLHLLIVRDVDNVAHITMKIARY